MQEIFSIFYNCFGPLVFPMGNGKGSPGIPKGGCGSAARAVPSPQAVIFGASGYVPGRGEPLCEVKEQPEIADRLRSLADR